MSFNSRGVVRGRAAALQLALKAEEGDGEIDWDAFAVKGTCQILEKSYFRLTSAPDPSTVRPQPVLEQALRCVQEHVEAGKENYFYAQDQLKAIRMDFHESVEKLHKTNRYSPSIKCDIRQRN